MKRFVPIFWSAIIQEAETKHNNYLHRRRRMKRNPLPANQYRVAAWVEPESSDRQEADLDEGNEDVRRLRPLTVLEHLSEASQPLTLAQLAGMMRVPKSTLMRLLRAMEVQGYVLYMPADRGFVTGNQSTTLALRLLRGSNIRRECRAVLRTLVRKLGETCNLTVPDAGRVLYVERIETTAPLRMHLEPGTWVPMHCTASGKLFLASMSLLDQRSVLAHLQLTKNAPRTIVDPKELEAELARIAKRGVGIDNEEFVRGMVAVAVPVRGDDNKLVAAVACHAPTARRSLDELLDGVPEMKRAAEEIRQILLSTVT